MKLSDFGKDSFKNLLNEKPKYCKDCIDHTEHKGCEFSGERMSDWDEACEYYKESE